MEVINIEAVNGDDEVIGGLKVGVTLKDSNTDRVSNFLIHSPGSSQS